MSLGIFMLALESERLSALVRVGSHNSIMPLQTSLAALLIFAALVVGVCLHPLHKPARAAAPLVAALACSLGICSMYFLQGASSVWPLQVLGDLMFSLSPPLLVFFWLQRAVPFGRRFVMECFGIGAITLGCLGAFTTVLDRPVALVLVCMLPLGGYALLTSMGEPDPAAKTGPWATLSNDGSGKGWTGLTLDNGGGREAAAHATGSDATRRTSRGPKDPGVTQPDAPTARKHADGPGRWNALRAIACPPHANARDGATSQVAENLPRHGGDAQATGAWSCGTAGTLASTSAQACGVRGATSRPQAGHSRSAVLGRALIKLVPFFCYALVFGSVHFSWVELQDEESVGIWVQLGASAGEVICGAAALALARLHWGRALESITHLLLAVFAIVALWLTTFLTSAYVFAYLVLLNIAQKLTFMLMLVFGFPFARNAGQCTALWALAYLSFFLGTFVSSLVGSTCTSLGLNIAAALALAVLLTADFAGIVSLYGGLGATSQEGRTATKAGTDPVEIRNPGVREQQVIPRVQESKGSGIENAADAVVPSTSPTATDLRREHGIDEASPSLTAASSVASDHMPTHSDPSNANVFGVENSKASQSPHSAVKPASMPMSVSQAYGPANTPATVGNTVNQSAESASSAVPGTHARPSAGFERLPYTCHLIACEYDLTRREEEILQLLVRGRTAARIAETLCITTATTRTHLRNIYAKLGVHSQQDVLDMFEDYASGEE